ncbi:MAG TPA: site-specific integrase, partial [Abditibacteriaceae bacterium]|nr:site-specific integrase [Abditibacteriaceae bacterium]
MPKSSIEKSSAARSPLMALHGHVDHFASHLQDARNASPHTVRSYTLDLVQFIAWLEQEEQLRRGQGWSHVTYLMIRRYLGHLSAQEYNRRSVVRKLSTLKAVFKWLERQNTITHNPAAQVLSPKTSRPLPDVL